MFSMSGVSCYFTGKVLGNPVKITSDIGKINKSKVPEYCFPVMKSLLYLNVLCVYVAPRGGKEKERRMEASVAIQVLPKAESDDEVCRIVDEVIAYIASTGLNYYVGPCETSIEGDYDTLMEIVKNCQKIAIKAGCASVSSYVKISYRPEGEVLTIDRKISKYHE